MDASESSQMLSALFMIAPLAHSDFEVTLTGEIRWPFVQMTHRLTLEFGQPLPKPDPKAEPLTAPPRSFRILSGHPYKLANSAYAIESDATAASYFLALPLATEGYLQLPNFQIREYALQGDTAFASILKHIGIKLTYRGYRPGMQTLWESGHSPRGITQDFSEFSDTFLTLAAIAPLLDGPTRITGIAHTRKQETDRVAGMARELKKLGQDVVEEEDALTIMPRPLKSGVEIETYGDHRFAMSFGILGCHDLHGDGRPWLSIKNPACCAKTFPNFFEVLETLRKKSLEE